MDPMTMMAIQGGVGLAQAAIGALKPRQEIDTSIAPEFEQNVQEARNLRQSTSAAFDAARKATAQREATQLAAAQRGATSSGALLRQQQLAGRQAAQTGAQLYQGELLAQQRESQQLMQARQALAGARQRSQDIKNAIAMQENQYLDQLVGAGVQNIMGGLQGATSIGMAREHGAALIAQSKAYGQSALGYGIDTWAGQVAPPPTQLAPPPSSALNTSNLWKMYGTNLNYLSNLPNK